MDLWSWLGVTAGSTEDDDAAFARFCTDAQWGMPRLWSQERIPLHEHEYWRRWLSILHSPVSTPGDASDRANTRISSALTVTNVRRALTRAPENVATLLEALVAHLECLSHDEHFCPPPRRGGQPYPPSGARDRVSEALVAVQIIAHVLPVVFEGDHDTHSLIQANGAIEPRVAHLSWIFERAVLWTASSPVQYQSEGIKSADPLGATATHRPQSGAKSDEPCLGHRLMTVLLDMLFFPGFTLPWRQEFVADFRRNPLQRARYVIWHPGVGSTIGIDGTTPDQTAHRTVLLRLTLVLLSRRVYHRSQDDILDDGLHHLATGYDRPVVLPFLCSLLNTVLIQTEDVSWTQWAKGWVSGPEVKSGISDELVQLCLQISAILLSYTTGAEGAQDEGEAAPAPQVNRFRYYLARLHRPTDYNLLWSGLNVWVEAGTHTHSLLGAESTQQSKHILEAVTVLWMALKVNVGFQAWVSLDPIKTNHLLACLLQFVLRFRSQEEHSALVTISAWMIQDLSVHKAWCACWSQPFFPSKLLSPTHLPLPPNKGTDALILVATTLAPWSLSHGSEDVVTALLKATRNTAPFWRDLSVVAATKFAQVAGSLAQPKVWLVGPPRGEWLGLLLESAARAWLSRPADQVNLLYALVTGAAADLAHIGEYDLPTALVHVQRLPARSLGDPAEVRRKAEAYRAGSYVPTEKGVNAWQTSLAPARTIVVDHLLAELVPALERYSEDIFLKPHAEQRILAFVRDWAVEHTPSGANDGRAEGMVSLTWEEVAATLAPALWSRALLTSRVPLWVGTRVRLPSSPA